MEFPSLLSYSESVNFKTLNYEILSEFVIDFFLI